MKVAFFNTKPYDRVSIESENTGQPVEISYFEPRLNASTALRNIRDIEASGSSANEVSQK